MWDDMRIADEPETRARIWLDRRQVLKSGLAASAAAVGGLPGIGASPASAQAATPGSAAAAEAVAAIADTIVGISREVWDLAEVSLAEVESMKVQLRALEAAGFATVSTGTSGVPTAFLCEWTQGTGGPIIAYLPEYDALPGLSNIAEPRQQGAGSEWGHGCGHAMLGAGATGGAIALKRMMEAAGTPGTIRVYGCASEETEGSKVYMVRDGLFADVDAAIAWHPLPAPAAGLVRCTGLNMVRVSFVGRTAHAGNSPWDGRSALKATGYRNGTTLNLDAAVGKIIAPGLTVGLGGFALNRLLKKSALDPVSGT